MRVVVTLQEVLTPYAAKLIVEQDQDDASLVCILHEPVIDKGNDTFDFTVSPAVAKELARALLIVAEEAQLLWE